MAVIGGSDYRSLTLEYAAARDSHLSMKQDFFDAVYLVVRLNVLDPEIDMLNLLFGNYQVNTGVVNSQEMFLSAVRTIQNHIVRRSGLTIDGYLESEGVTVPQTWADMSARVGFTISASNID
jgi:hypothetical protein